MKTTKELLMEAATRLRDSAQAFEEDEGKGFKLTEDLRRAASDIDEIIEQLEDL